MSKKKAKKLRSVSDREIKGAFRVLARDYESEGNLELDDKAPVSISMDTAPMINGAYIQMWKYLPAIDLPGDLVRRLRAEERMEAEDPEEQ